MDVIDGGQRGYAAMLDTLNEACADRHADAVGVIHDAIGGVLGQLRSVAELQGAALAIAERLAGEIEEVERARSA